MTDQDMDSAHAAVPDEELMQRVARRDREAFVILVRRHQNSLVNFFRRMGDYSDAEDLAQETFVRLFKYRNRYQPTAAFKTFLYLLARRAWIDHVRKQGRRRKVHEELAESQMAETGADTPAFSEAKARAQAALNRLPDDMRTVVIMSIYRGFKYREIAQMLKIPLGTVKTRMFYALKKLKEVMTDECGE